ncbi:tripartite tricarboxylate transporter TctB family protein [Sagittula salina]|uniref:Tripartite tricarboxylate transporter TctB family protein n=1 Tax=Sagittula salina TaxID=2820268 RepID=A0A940MNC8_9RHOB|nr:tripartite tricarboxylate transporter TctB family protein [Sagittula salina]MBP0485080.1 tripartite tricarboxylate transporter TctB family protein [Sagittula salina]
MSLETDLRARTRGAGQILFVAAFLGLSVILLSQIAAQTAWIEKARSFAAQPRFWPAVALGTMVVSLALHLWQMTRRRPRREDWQEARRWLEPVEYAGWFMAYVFLVPWIGFLPMSLALACGLSWRLGYRSVRWMALAAAFALGTVLLFKGMLGVKIPGAVLYEALPDGWRGFALQYL